VQNGQTHEWTYWNPNYEPKWTASEAELTDQLEAFFSKYADPKYNF
jgi:hypothetical protein